MTFARYIQAILLAFMTAIPLTSCAQEPELIGLTSVVFNYSQETLIFVEINGKQAGRGVDEAKLGEFKGGGKSMCCIHLSPQWRSVNIEITITGGKKIVVPATIEQPWPKFVHYAAVHILPGKKAVIEITPSIPWQRMDLLETQLKEMRHKK